MANGKPGRPDYVKQIISFFNKNPNASQIDCAETLKIDKDTVNKILNRKPKIAFLDCIQIPETPDDPYVSLMYITPKGDVVMLGAIHGFTAHSVLLQKAGSLKSKGNKVYLFTASQSKNGIHFSPQYSKEDIELRKIRSAHGWGEKKL